MEKLYFSVYGKVGIDHSEDKIVLHTSKTNIDDVKAEDIMQDYVDEHRDEFKGKKFVNTIQYAVDRFCGDVI